MSRDSVEVTWIVETDAWLPLERPSTLQGLLQVARALGYLPRNAQQRHFQLYAHGNDLCIVRKATQCIEYTFRSETGERTDTFTELPWARAPKPSGE